MVAINSSDTGSGLDGPGLDAYGSGYYSGALYGDYSYVRVVATGLSDSASGVDSGSYVTSNPLISSSDSGHGVDTGSVPSMIPRSSSDSGLGVEFAVAITPPGAYPMDYDLGFGLDSQPFPIGHIPASDLGTGVETQPPGIASPSGSVRPLNRDTGLGVDSSSVTKVISSSDSALGVDTQNILCGIALVQSNSVNSGTTLETSQAITLPNGIALGNLIVACVGDDSDDGVISGPPGFQQAVINSPTGTLETSIWYAIVTPVMAGQTSWTFTSEILVSIALSISEYNSIYGWQPNPLDQIAQGNTKQNTSASSTVDSGTTPLTTQLAELCVASLCYGGQQGFTTNTDWNADQQTEGSFVSLADLYLMVDTLTSADCNIMIGSPYFWAGCVATFMPVQPQLVVSSDSGSGVDSAGEERTGTITFVYSSDFETSTGTDSVTSAAVPGTLYLNDQDIGRGFDGSPSTYGQGTYGANLYSPGASVPVVSLPTGSGAHTGMLDYAIGQEKQSVKIHGPGSEGEFPFVGPSSMTNIFEGFSLSRAGVLSPTSGAETNQLYGAQTITLAPNVTTTDMQSDDWDIGAWYWMDKANLTVVNGFMSWSTLSALAGTAISSSGMSPHDYYGLPLWTQYQHNQTPVPIAFRMASKNANSAQRTLDFILYRVQLSVLDFTGTAYKQGLSVSYAGTVLFSNVDEVGNTLVDEYGFPAPQVGRWVSSPGNQVGAFTKAYA